ncbi:MAG: tRNA (adenosine(37)-N6)-threonylcarbamoyltransferase complex ATPase subunit type 1 TsaE [Phycisphaerales bacterium]|nr:tRNA (adenosine(37)-N6)-threonylcarbamoyltransferase complex ATPase subunit type 1 TsaE [Phycisphaerales bacterium]
MRLDFTLQSLADTRALGEALARLLGPGDVLSLTGDLGAGKTTLTREIALARGVDPGMVSSPTFVIVNEYPTPTGPPVVHVDAYRLTSAEDLDALGWDRLADGGSVLVIEWAERIGEALPQERTARLTIASTGEASRSVSLEAPEAWASRPAISGLRDLALPARQATRCPVTGRRVPGDSPTWPFASEQARMADLYRWFSGQYEMSRPVEESDLEEGD